MIKAPGLDLLIKWNLRDFVSLKHGIHDSWGQLRPCRRNLCLDRGEFPNVGSIPCWIPRQDDNTVLALEIPINKPLWLPLSPSASWLGGDRSNSQMIFVSVKAEWHNQKKENHGPEERWHPTHHSCHRRFFSNFRGHHGSHVTKRRPAGLRKTRNTGMKKGVKHHNMMVQFLKI